LSKKTGEMSRIVVAKSIPVVHNTPSKTVGRVVLAISARSRFQIIRYPKAGSSAVRSLEAARSPDGVSLRPSSPNPARRVDVFRVCPFFFFLEVAIAALKEVLWSVPVIAEASR
jgi:hypothetical protein